ncbi:hypothetical protein [Nostoc sp. C110]|uniref:hypothetical protein n=1 Tax=Nostoc sp. C110 TaxID=3349876 RepID=UPI00370DDE40
MRQNLIYRQGLLKTLTLALFILASVMPPSVLANESGKSPTFDGTTTLQTILTSSHRSLANRDRDKYRHPAETLKFFGLRPNMTVVELWPGSGWYTEILAPFLASKGQLIVTNSASSSKPTLAFQQKLAANPEVFGKVKVVPINPPNELTLAPDNSVDLVFLPVPATTESSAAFSSCVNVKSPAFLLTIALDIQDSRYNFLQHFRI